jgi:serine phosphatase RsbU (regulator of sigma subunit)
LDEPARLGALERTGLLDVATDPVLDRLTRLAARVIGAPVSLVSLVDTTRQHFTSQVGLPAPWAGLAETPLSHSFCQLVVTSGERLVVDDAKADERVRDNLAIPDLGVQAYAGFPLVDDDGNVLGSFCVLDDAPRAWTDDELESIADIAAAAASEIRARQALRVSAERVTVLADMTRTLHADLDARTTARALAAHLVPVLADVCVVDLANAGSGQPHSTVVVAADPRLAEAFEAAEARWPRATLPASGVYRILHGGGAELLTLDDALYAQVGVDAEHRRMYGGLGLVEAVMAPVVSRAGIEGVLTLGRTLGSRPYTDEDVQLADEVGRRIGVAVENARLYARERDTAVTLQHSLLPRLPELPGLALAARYVPSSLAGQVGGDWYDVLALPDGSVGIAVGDVVGHDLTAAAGMGQLRAVLRSYAWDDDSPGSVLDRVCRLVRGLDEETFATALYARLAAPAADGSRELVYASAGHPPPVLLLPDGRTELLETVSPLLGLETAPRSESTVRLPAGATLIGYSDGLVERRGEDLAVGLGVLQRAAAEHAGADVEDLAERLLATLVPEGSDDDVALLVLRAL